jgi:hypothetical protein
MGTIWTPGGERPVDTPEPSGGTEPDREPTPEEFEAELAEVQRQLAETPARVVITNHCVGLFNLAALYLNQPEPNYDEAQLAIDALAAVVDGLGERLGEDAPVLADALAQIRLAFVQVKAGQEGQPPPG